MSIHEPIQESDDGILVGDPLFSIWVEVEGHLVVSLDFHELVVKAQHWSQDWLLLYVSFEGLPIHHCYIFLIKIIYCISFNSLITLPL
ncbi:MAG TPA: hypothetical protein VHA52_01340, partial [Candidatus Babeliaceae bacterium]|nr:hypothetical protein [Candidatus Babeliaceae bacterium]